MRTGRVELLAPISVNSYITGAPCPVVINPGIYDFQIQETNPLGQAVKWFALNVEGSWFSASNKYVLDTWADELKFL